MASRRERQQPGTGLNGPSPSKTQRRVMRKLQARIDGYEGLLNGKGSQKKSGNAYKRPGSQNLKKPSS